MTKQTALSIIAVFWLLSIICGGVAGFYTYPYLHPCNSNVGSVVVSVTDSTAPAKDTGIIAINTQPKLKETRKYKGNSNQISKPNEINTFVEKVDTIGFYSQISNCLDTNIFTVDTQAVDNFKAHATATVTNNQLIGLLIEYQNFKPEKWKVLSKTVTVEKKQALIKVFPELYARATFNAVTATGGGAGGGASFVVKDKHMIGVDAGANFGIGQPVSGEVLLRYGVKLQLK